MGENSIGGLIGQKAFSSDAKFSISNCYTICEVKGKNYVGGLIGDYKKVNSNIVPNSKIKLYLDNYVSYCKNKGNSNTTINNDMPG